MGSSSAQKRAGQPALFSLISFRRTSPMKNLRLSDFFGLISRPAELASQ